VAALAQVLYGHGANILDSDQHTDGAAGLFFQRIRFDIAELMTDRMTLERAIAEVGARFSMRYELLYADRPKKIAIFVSKYDHCLYDLLLRMRAGELAGEIAAIVSNHADLAPISAQFGIPYHLFEKTGETKTSQESKERALLADLGVDLVVLARYMQVLTREFCDVFAHRVINIHHSFLPAFVGGRPYQQAYERGVKLIGATAHFVTTDLDEGPIIEQDVARVGHGHTPDQLVAIGRDIERLVLARAVRLYAEDRVVLAGARTVVFD